MTRAWRSLVGGSKTTLYVHFQSKEEIFEAAVMAAVKDLRDQIIPLLRGGGADLRGMLVQFARKYLSLKLADEVLAMTRSIIEQGFDPKFSAKLFAYGPAPAKPWMFSCGLMPLKDPQPHRTPLVRRR